MRLRIKIKKDFFGFRDLKNPIIEINFKFIGLKSELLNELELLKTKVNDA